MSIVSVDNIQPIGSGTTVTVNKSVTLESGNTNITGVCTATSFVGSGANLTNLPAANLTGTLPAISGANLTSLPAQATISNNADNRVITGGSGVNLNGEAGLTYNGQALNVNSVTSENNAFRVYNTSTSATTFQINGEGNSFIGHTYPRSDANLDLGFHSGYRWRDVVLSGGIRFGSSSSDDYLDDYEEGSWTPTLTGYTSGNTQTYAAQHGSYTKVGRVVTAHFDVKLSNKGNISGTYILLQGLPFNHAGSRAGTGSVHFFQHLTSSVSSMALEGGGGIASSFWLLCVNGTQSTQLSYTPDSFISNSTQIAGTLVYRVS